MVTKRLGGWFDSSPTVDEPEYEYEYVETEAAKAHTRHISVIEWMDGDSETVEWDEKWTKDGMLILLEYTGYDDGGPRREGRRRGPAGFQKQVIASYPVENIRRFETTGREERAIEFTTMRRKRVRVDEDGDDE